MTDPITLTAQNDALNDIIRSKSAEIDRLKAEVERLEYELSGYRRAATIVPPRDTLPSPGPSESYLHMAGPMMTLMTFEGDDGKCP